MLIAIRSEIVVFHLNHYTLLRKFQFNLLQYYCSTRALVCFRNYAAGILAWVMASLLRRNNPLIVLNIYPFHKLFDFEIFCKSRRRCEFRVLFYSRPARDHDKLLL